MKIDKFNTYQDKIKETINFKYPELENYTLGLVCESGEFGEIINKHLNHGYDLDMNKVKSELGLIMWYVGNVCNVLNIQLEDVANENIKRLEKLYKNGFLETDICNFNK